MILQPLLPTTALGNVKEQHMRIWILILGLWVKKRTSTRKGPPWNGLLVKDLDPAVFSALLRSSFSRTPLRLVDQNLVLIILVYVVPDGKQTTNCSHAVLESNSTVIYCVMTLRVSFYSSRHINVCLNGIRLALFAPQYASLFAGCKSLLKKVLSFLQFVRY